MNTAGNKPQTRDKFIGREFQVNDNISSQDVEAFLRDRFPERLLYGNIRIDRGGIEAQSLFGRRMQIQPKTPMTTREALDKALRILSPIEVNHDTIEEEEKKQDS